MSCVFAALVDAPGWRRLVPTAGLRCPGGRLGLQPGWYFYDTLDLGRIRCAGNDVPGFLNGEAPSNISAMLYERRMADGRRRVRVLCAVPPCQRMCWPRTQPTWALLTDC